jgi:hypothetical protein
MKKDKAYLKDMLDAISDIDDKNMASQQEILNSGIVDPIRCLLSNGVNEVARLF